VPGGTFLWGPGQCVDTGTCRLRLFEVSLVYVCIAESFTSMTPSTGLELLFAWGGAVCEQFLYIICAMYLSLRVHTVGRSWEVGAVPDDSGIGRFYNAQSWKQKTSGERLPESQALMKSHT
jgi:hypothetical protein